MSAVPGGCHHDAALVTHVARGVQDTEAARYALETDIRDAGTVIRGPDQALRDHAVVPQPRGISDSNRHDPSPPVHAGYANAVAAGRRSDSRHSGAVPGRVARIVIAVVKIPAGCHTRGKRRMRCIDSAVEYCDGHTFALSRTPRRFGPDLR